MYMLYCQHSGGEDTRNPTSRPILEPSKGGGSTHRAGAAHAQPSVRLCTVRDRRWVHTRGVQCKCACCTLYCERSGGEDTLNPHGLGLGFALGRARWMHGTYERCAVQMYMLYCQHSGGEKTRSRLGVFCCRWITITHVHTEKSDFCLPHFLCLLGPQLAVGGMSPIFSFSVTRHLRQVVDVVSTKRGGG